jgi:hypothetical protein
MGPTLNAPTRTSPRLRYACGEALTGGESRSPLPAFKNLGRGVF